MNPHFYPLSNGPCYDQKPSTSNPMQQLNNMPLRSNPQFQRVELVDSWMDPYRNTSYSASPAPSVRSSNSVMSAGSMMSAMSQLSINTNFTEYSTMPWNMMPSMGTENIYPVQPVHWTAQGVEAEVCQIIHTLRSVNLVNLEKTQIQKIFQCLQCLIMDQSGREAQANVHIPLDCLSDGTMKELLGAMFGSLKYEEQKLELLEPRIRTHWNHLVNRILKYLFHIYRRYSNKQSTNKFDQFVEQLPGTPIRILASLLIPNKEFTLFAIKLFYFLVRSSALRPKRTLELSKDTKCFDNLTRIVCPDQEYMNQLERQLSLDCICSFLVSDRCQRRLIESKLIPEMLRRYFVPNGEEHVLYKIPQLLLKVSNKKRISEHFFLQLESVRAYTLIANMLSHGSPRVLLSCLNFLTSLHPTIVQRITDLHQLIVATLRLAGSTEVHITKAAIKFLHLATSNNPVVKADITRQNGVQCILACLRQNYSSIQDPNLNVAQITLHAAEIKNLGMEIVRCLVKTPELSAGSDYPTNPESTMAKAQVSSYPHLCELVCNWLNETLDNGRLPMINLLGEVLPGCDADTLNMLLSRKVLLDDRSGEKCAAEILVGCLFTMYHKHDDIQAKNPMEAETMQKITYQLLTLFWRIFQRPGADILFVFLGRPSPPQHNLTNLFMESTSTQNVNMRHLLFQFMASISNRDSDRKLIRGWAAHPHFQAVMDCFSQDPGCVASVHQMCSALAQPVLPVIN